MPWSREPPADPPRTQLPPRGTPCPIHRRRGNACRAALCVRAVQVIGNEFLLHGADANRPGVLHAPGGCPDVVLVTGQGDSGLRQLSASRPSAVFRSRTSLILKRSLPRVLRVSSHRVWLDSSNAATDPVAGRPYSSAQLTPPAPTAEDRCGPGRNHAGNSYEVCLTTQIFSNLYEGVDPWEFYRRLRRASPSPWI